MEDVKTRELLNKKMKHIMKAKALTKRLREEKKIIGDIEVELLRRGNDK
jgi:hypothetical protein